MIKTVIYALSNLFRIYLLRKYIQIFLKDEMEEKVTLKEMLAYGGFFLLNTGASLIFHLVWLNILINVVGISLIVCIYTKSAKMTLFLTCSIYMIHMGCDVISYFLLGSLERKEVNLVSAVTTAILIFICELITEKIVNYRKNVNEAWNVPLIFVPVCSMIIVWLIVSVMDIRSRRIFIVVVSASLLIVNFLVLYLYNVLLKAFSQKYENEMLKQKVQVYAHQLEAILQNEDRVKRLRHDMKHHMNELKLLAIKNGDLFIQEYIDSMEEFIKDPKEIVSSGNMEIDSILNYMLQRAREGLREVKAQVQLPSDMSHSFDINVILGNLLENAIEAARETEEKLLDVKVKLKQGVLRIEVENSFGQELLIEKPSKGSNNSMEGVLRNDIRLYTTKRDKGEHGIGLVSVRKIVEKHNGIMEIYPKENHFFVKLILYI